MYQTSSPTDPVDAMKQSQFKMITNRSQLIELNQVPLPLQQSHNFKVSGIFDNNARVFFLKEITRFVVYTLFVFIILSIISKNPTATIYSFISKAQNDNTITSKKQIPGLFPSLSNNWQSLINKWNITLINGKYGTVSYKQNNYQLQFKHSEQKQNVVYLTKKSCEGHLIMNWDIYGNNIYFTEFVVPKSSMIIPNEPKDEQCIKQKPEILNLLKLSTIWTINVENEKTCLFLLAEQTNDKNQHSNYVIIADQSKKI